MKNSYIAVISGVVLSSLFLVGPKSQAQPNNCELVEGHIAGHVIGQTSDCGGALTEVGPFTDSDGNLLGSFEACETGGEQEGEGASKLQLVHTYTTNAGDKFFTADNIVLSPIDPPLLGVNNRAIVTGGTGRFEGASGFIEDHGTFNSETGEVSVDYHGRICTP